MTLTVFKVLYLHDSETCEKIHLDKMYALVIDLNSNS